MSQWWECKDETDYHSLGIQDLYVINKAKLRSPERKFSRYFLLLGDQYEKFEGYLEVNKSVYNNLSEGDRYASRIVLITNTNYLAVITDSISESEAIKEIQSRYHINPYIRDVVYFILTIPILVIIIYLTYRR